MTAWIELLTRELAMLALLAALGSGPAALLHRSHDRATRLALGPAYGLALGMCVLTTGLWRIPGDKLVWAGLLPLVLASLSVASFVRRARRDEDRPRRDAKGKLQIGALLAIVLIGLSWPLASEDTVGPIGGYAVADAVGYTAEILGAQEQSIRTTADTPGPLADLSLAYWRGISNGYQQIGFDAIEATANPALGLHATDTLAPFLIAILAVTALGIFAAVRMLTGTRSWLAVLAGALAAGPLFIQILTDGSQGAIVGQSMVVPFALAMIAALKHQRLQDFLLVGLLAAGVQTGYPLFVPPLVLGSVVALALLLVARRKVAWRVVGGLGALLVVAVAATPYAFSRNYDYWTRILRGEQSYDGLPAYDLELEKLFGWLLQTREFYALNPVSDAPVTAGAIPALILGLIVFGLVKFAAARWLVLLVGASALLAFYTASSEGCSYCTQRNLLPAGPVVAALIGVGLVATAKRNVLVGAAAALMLVVWVGDKHIYASERQRDAAYQLDPELREVVQKIPRSTTEPIHLEGFGQGPKAPMEEPLAYHAANEQTDGPLSIAAFLDDAKGQFYLGGIKSPPGPELRTDHRYVLTRLASVDSGRRTVAKRGPIALQERSGELDVTIESGVAIAFADVDPSGTAFLPGTALELFVTGGQPGRKAWVRLVLEELGSVNVVPGLDLDARRLPGSRIEICVQSRGEPPGRLASVVFEGSTPAPARAAESEFEIPPPAAIAKILSVRATQRDCSPLSALDP